MSDVSVQDLRALEKILNRIPKEKLAELERLPGLANALDRHWIPNPGPQQWACETPADELFFGGEAGGGKSEILMGLAATQHQNSLLLRRTNKEASKFIKRFEQIVGTREGWNGQLSTFRLPDGRVVEFGGCEYEEDKQKYKGDPHDLIAFDEVADFTETQFRFIIGWNRSADKNQRCRVIAAGNPPTRPEGLWVFKYWAAWLDPTHPNPAKQGELRWYTTVNGVDTEVDGPGPHKIPGEPKPIMARSRTFIRSRLEDNPDLDDAGYDAVRAALPDELRAAYREGRFDVAFKDDEWQVIPTAWIMAAQERWEPDGWHGLKMTAMGLDPAGGGYDEAVLAPRYGGWYAPLICAHGSETTDGSMIAGLVIRHRHDNCPIIVDVGGGYAGAVIERFKDNDIAFQRFDGRGVSGYRTMGSMLRCANRRMEAYWQFREALDPDQEGGSPIALPPDPELRADLAAARYSRTAKGVLQVEDKEKTKARIGRSPDKADAVVMAYAEGNRVTEKRERQKRGRPRVLFNYAKQKRFRG